MQCPQKTQFLKVKPIFQEATNILTYISTRAVASLISVEVIEYLFSLTFGSGDELGASSISTGLNSLTSSGMPTPSSGTRPGSQTNSTNSYIQSCSSQMSGVDDRRLDEILADGIQNQVHFLTCNLVVISLSRSELLVALVNKPAQSMYCVAAQRHLILS